MLVSRPKNKRENTSDFFFAFIASHIEDHRKYQIEDQEQLIMYSNQDPVLASSSGMLKHNSRTGSPLASPGVVSEIVLPPGAIALDRAMISK